MNIRLTLLGMFFLFLSTICNDAYAQWPKVVTGKQGEKITIYQFQPENVKGNDVSGRCPFSIKYNTSDDYIFGLFWFDAKVSTDTKTQITTLISIAVTDIKLPDVTDSMDLVEIKSILETEVPKLKISGSMDDIHAALNQEQSATTTNFNNKAPLIYYKNTPTTLVIIDGEPKIEEDKELKVKRVINTAFLLVQDPGNSKFYLYGGMTWYVSSSVKEGYVATTKLPGNVSALDKKLKSQGKLNAPPTTTSTPADSAAPVILISTVPAELLQTKGDAEFANIEGTSLLYVSNSEEDIFKNINDQNYYILLSGRWYSAPKLSGTWTFEASDKLPEDFKKIPAGSTKDNVLASVAGTDASKDAVKEAQVPQTAKVNKDSMTCTVNYDGTPVFEKIEGTSLELAKNTGSTVIKSGKSYYVLENGVWFISANATGPWKVSDDRPKDLDKIPPSSPAYNAQNVYIYESTPQVVYVGYTPAYMGCYVYGGTVVYGTGYYYNPWYGPYYYPMPMTYGYSMHYNPYMGWSMSVHSYYGCYHAVYFGPPMYRPPYYAHYHGGMYGHHGPTYIHNDVDINVDRSNNIYNNRNGVNTNDVKRGDYNKPSTMDQRNGQRAQSSVPRATDQRANTGMGNNGNRQPAAGNNAANGNRAGAGAANNRSAGNRQQPATGNRTGGNMGAGNMGGGDGGFGGRGGFGGGGGGNFGGGGGGGRMGGGGGRR